MESGASHSIILRHTCFLATLCSIIAWAPPQTAHQPRPCRLRAAQLDADAYPPAPWSFSNARVMYQPTLVRTSAARAVTPSDGLTLLSFLGYTLGGVFVVDWTESPVGPYREVAVLSGLVARGLSIGAWASHIDLLQLDNLCVFVKRHVIKLYPCRGFFRI